MNSQGARYDPLFILKPFSWYVWFATLALLVLSVVTFRTVLRLIPRDGDNYWWRAISHAFTHGLGGPPHTEVPESISRVSPPLMFCTGLLSLILGIFMLSVYNSAITGTILEIHSTPPFRGIQDVIKCAIPLDQLVVVNNSASRLYLESFVSNQPCHLEKNLTPSFAKSVSDAMQTINSHGKALYYSGSRKIVRSKFVLYFPSPVQLQSLDHLTYNFFVALVFLT